MAGSAVVDRSCAYSDRIQTFTLGALGLCSNSNVDTSPRFPYRLQIDGSDCFWICYRQFGIRAMEPNFHYLCCDFNRFSDAHVYR